MTNKEYIELTKRTDNEDLDFSNKQLIHAMLGIASESGEIASIIKKHTCYNLPLDIQKLKDESGDLLWYMSRLLRTIGSDFSEIMCMNISKLQERYKDKFTTSEAVLQRDKLKETGQ